jgi:7-cyano-7-deazaguanine synthase
MVDSVAIVSGGLDSVTLLHHLVKEEKRQTAVITFHYGQKHHKEVQCAIAQAQMVGCSHHLVLDLTVMQPLFAASALVSPAVTVPDADSVRGNPQPITYVPNRNMIFLALAVAYAETCAAMTGGSTPVVYYGAQQQDIYGYWDTTPDFLERLNEVYQLNRTMPVQIRAPFVTHSKTDILRLGLALGVDYGQTWSCYEGKEVACGRCPTCVERLTAFAEVGMTDPLPYDSVTEWPGSS